MKKIYLKVFNTRMESYQRKNLLESILECHNVIFSRKEFTWKNSGMSQSNLLNEIICLEVRMPTFQSIFFIEQICCRSAWLIQVEELSMEWLDQDWLEIYSMCHAHTVHVGYYFFLAMIQCRMLGECTV